MKNVKLVKNLLVIMVSLILVFALSQSNFVFAAENDTLFEPITANNTTDNNTADDNTAGNNLVGNNTIGNNIVGNISGNISSNSSANNTLTNRSISNSNELADTGISNVGGIITLIVVVCGISAIYSYKKVNDYKNL